MNKLIYFSALSWIFCACSESASHDEGSGMVSVKTCDESQNMCLSSAEVLHCADGVRKREYCASGERCYDGRCGAVVCDPFAIESCLENGKYRGCNPMGTGTGDFDCENGKTCVNGQCVSRLCQAGAGKCIDSETILLCNEAGTSYSVEKKCQDIKDKTVCEEGKCISICEQNSKNASYIGCEYWAVDLDNAIDAGVYDAAGGPFAVVLSNTHASLTANVNISYKYGGTVSSQYTFEIPPETLKTVYLPSSECYSGRPETGAGGACARAYSVNGTNISDSAYRIVSDLPITAAQFNPLNNEGVFSNDATLLFPTTALGKRYMALGRKQHYDSMSAFVTIVPAESGQTQVAVSASCGFQAGTDKSGKPIYSMKRGDTQTFYLEQFDVLNLETSGLGEDPTGTVIASDKKIAVFVGNEATSLPETDPVTCCADHIEHQQYPLSAWGREYNAVKLKPRKKERDLWRILARSDGTIVKTEPAVMFDEAVHLNAGQWVDIVTVKSFMIKSSQPVLVAQFMTGQNDPLDLETGTLTDDSARIGDPAYLIGVPIEQYRSSYYFLTPARYAQDYITVIAPLNASVKLDGTEISSSAFTAFGDGSYRAAYIQVSDGPHRLDATEPVGLFSYGYDDYVSYGYPAGLDLKELFSQQETEN